MQITSVRCVFLFSLKYYDNIISCYLCCERQGKQCTFFFLRKAKHCFHRETDASLLPPWLLYQRGGMVTLLSSSHCSQKAGQIIPQCYFSLSCEKSIVLLLYCETMCSVVGCPLTTTRLSTSPFGCGEQGAQQLQYCNKVSFLTLTLWFKD